MTDGRRVRGDRTRATILDRGLELATVKGLDGFSIGELADRAGITKAGVAGLFGPKLDLQCAIAEHARGVLAERIFDPVLAAPRGRGQLETLGRSWLDYLADPALIGGCFFAAAAFEVDAQPGPLRDQIGADMRRWLMSIERILIDGQANGEIDTSISASDEALTFFSIGITANSMIQLGVIDDAGGRARRNWDRQIERIQDQGTGAIS